MHFSNTIYNTVNNIQFTLIKFKIFSQFPFIFIDDDFFKTEILLMNFLKLKPDKIVSYYIWNHQAHLTSDAISKTYLGTDSRSSSYVTIRIIEPSCFSCSKEVYQKFQASLRSIFNLNLESVRPLIDLAFLDNSLLIIEKYCDGFDLRQIMQLKKGKSSKGNSTEVDDNVIKMVIKNSQDGNFSENVGAKICREIIQAFEGLRSKNIIHGDLKPENIVVNQSKFLVGGYGLNEIIGNIKGNDEIEIFYYKSPQILSKIKYTDKTDVWSLGVILYELIYGRRPWIGKETNEYLKNIKSMPIRFPSIENVSEITKDFILGCLKYSESERISWERVFDHPFYKNSETVGSEKVQIKKSLLTGKEKVSNFVKEAQNIIRKQNLDIELLFKRLDTSADGTMDAHEFLKFIMIIDAKVNTKETYEIFDFFDVNKDGTISLEEFKQTIIDSDINDNAENEILARYRGQIMLQHTVNIILENQINIKEVIEKFDKTRDGQLRLGEFIPILKVFVPSITDEDCKYVFKLIDKNGNGEIDCLEFLARLDEETNSKKIKENFSGNNKVIDNKCLLELKNIINYNKIDVNMIFKSLDKSGDKKLDFLEFCKLVEVINMRYSSNELKQAFDLLDKDKDGGISIEEFKSKLKE